jgi:peptidoglycan hydrolase-like protein with peptidoglycan-binding domain
MAAKPVSSYEEIRGTTHHGEVDRMTAEAPWPILANGSEGADVTALQYLLRGSGARTLAADGVYGPATAETVSAFQNNVGVSVDGIVGPLTWRKLTDGTTLASTVRSGDQGDFVKAAQTELLEHGDLHSVTEVDGIFGSNTDTATRHFQKSAGLPSDGVVGPLTWNQLIALAGD